MSSVTNLTRSDFYYTSSHQNFGFHGSKPNSVTSKMECISSRLSQGGIEMDETSVGTFLDVSAKLKILWILELGHKGWGRQCPGRFQYTVECNFRKWYVAILPWNGNKEFLIPQLLLNGLVGVNHKELHLPCVHDWKSWPFRGTKKNCYIWIGTAKGIHTDKKRHYI